MLSELLRSKDEELRRTLEEKSRLVAELRVNDRPTMIVVFFWLAQNPLAGFNEVNSMYRWRHSLHFLETCTKLKNHWGLFVFCCCCYCFGLFFLGGEVYFGKVNGWLRSEICILHREPCLVLMRSSFKIWLDFPREPTWRRGQQQVKYAISHFLVECVVFVVSSFESLLIRFFWLYFNCLTMISLTLTISPLSRATSTVTLWRQGIV